MFRAVLDTNVFVSALIRPAGPPGRLLEEFLSRGGFEIVLTPAIVSEVRRALQYPRVQKRLARGVDAELWFDQIVVVSDLVDAVDITVKVARDHDDDKFLAAAIAGHAEIVVSGDDDLLSLGEHEGVRIVTPRAFLALLKG